VAKTTHGRRRSADPGGGIAVLDPTTPRRRHDPGEPDAYEHQVINNTGSNGGASLLLCTLTVTSSTIARTGLSSDGGAPDGGQRLALSIRHRGHCNDAVKGAACRSLAPARQPSTAADRRTRLPTAARYSSAASTVIPQQLWDVISARALRLRCAATKRRVRPSTVTPFSCARSAAPRNSPGRSRPRLPTSRSFAQRDTSRGSCRMARASASPDEWRLRHIVGGHSRGKQVRLTATRPARLARRLLTARHVHPVDIPSHRSS